MIRVSSGTAACLGLQNNQMDVYPTTAYLISGEHCLMNCSFCPQSNRGNKGIGRLGRITWPEYSWVEIEKALSNTAENGLRRICLQAVRDKDGIKPLIPTITRLKKISELPLSLSAWVDNQAELRTVFDAGVERASISLDVVNPIAYSQIKGGSFQKRLDLLIECADIYPGKMSTHLICGFGETEKETLTLTNTLLQADITVALFAFIPLRNTKLAKAKPPTVQHYRRIQVGAYLLKERLASFSQFVFDKGRLVSYGLTTTELADKIFNGVAFQTSGCPGCNRPYYNERPGDTIYNYHRQLKKSESEQAINVLLDSLS